MSPATQLRHNAAILAGLSAISIFGCEQNRAAPEPSAAATGAGTTATGAGTTAAGVDAIKESPERFYGKTVTVSGGVDQIYTDRAFELEGTGWAFNDNITVLTRTPVTISGAPLTSDDDVIVTGKVRPFVSAEVERDIGWDIGPDVEVRLTRRPVLVADSIRRVNELGRWPATGAGGTGTGAAGDIQSVLMIVTSVDPSAMAGRKVDLGRERVHAVTGKGFWVGPSQMSQIFVMPRDAAGMRDIQAGDLVHVTGTAQKAPKDAAKAWELPSNMQGIIWDQMLYIDAANVTEVDKNTGSGTRPGTEPKTGGQRGQDGQRPDGGQR